MTGALWPRRNVASLYVIGRGFGAISHRCRCAAPGVIVLVMDLASVTGLVRG